MEASCPSKPSRGVKMDSNRLSLSWLCIVRLTSLRHLSKWCTSVIIIVQVLECTGKPVAASPLIFFRTLWLWLYILVMVMVTQLWIGMDTSFYSALELPSTWQKIRKVHKVKALLIFPGEVKRPEPLPTTWSSHHWGAAEAPTGAKPILQTSQGEVDRPSQFPTNPSLKSPRASLTFQVLTFIQSFTADSVPVMWKST